MTEAVDIAAAAVLNEHDTPATPAVPVSNQPVDSNSVAQEGFPDTVVKAFTDLVQSAPKELHIAVGPAGFTDRDAGVDAHTRMITAVLAAAVVDPTEDIGEVVRDEAVTEDATADVKEAPAVEADDPWTTSCSAEEEEVVMDEGVVGKANDTACPERGTTDVIEVKLDRATDRALSEESSREPVTDDGECLGVRDGSLWANVSGRRCACFVMGLMGMLVVLWWRLCAVWSCF